MDFTAESPKFRETLLEMGLQNTRIQPFPYSIRLQSIRTLIHFVHFRTDLQ